MKISEKIVAVYEKKLGNLSREKRLHWLVRRYRTTGQNKYTDLIFENYKHQAAKILPLIQKLECVSGAKKIGREILVNIKPVGSRTARRIPVYSEYPQVLTYLKILRFLFLTKSLNLVDDKAVGAGYRKGLSFFKANDVAPCFFLAKFVAVNPSETANVVYYLKYLKASDYEERLLTEFKKQYLDLRPNNSDAWQDKIYALTHLVIAASNFYQNFVDEEQFGWIPDYFKRDTLRIIRKVNLDALAEAGVCFKLLMRFNDPALAEIKEALAKKYDGLKGYIPREANNSLNRAEHRNILVTMLFSSFDRLYPGPDLSLLGT